LLRSLTINEIQGLRQIYAQNMNTNGKNTMRKKYSHDQLSTLLNHTPLATRALHYDIINVAGDDATTFLQSQFTCDVHSLKESAIPAAYCDRKGKVLCRLHLSKKNSDYQLLVLQTNTNALIKTLKKYALFSKVTMEVDSSQQLIGYVGDTNVLNCSDSTSHWSITDTITVLQTTEHLLDSVWTEVMLHATEIDHNAWQCALQQAFYIEIEPSTRLQFTPHMLGMDQHSGLCFNKGCYLGQEVIARTEHLGKPKRTLVNFTGDHTETAAINTSIIDSENKTVGTLLQISRLSEQQFLGTACISISAMSADLFLQSTPITVLS
jgi:tRNA-modifying protein YgfZ